MNSADRHEARYRRRHRSRIEAKRSCTSSADDFDTVFSYGNLYRSYLKCRRNVGWKASVQRYIANAPLNVYTTWEQLRNGTYKSPAFHEFTVFERGKKRYIKSTGIGERVVQNCLCENSLLPLFQRTFIHDNGACLPGKGYDFSVRRMRCHLQRHIRKHGTDGYILICDLSSFFDSVPHSEAVKALSEQIADGRILRLTEELIRQFDPENPPECRKGLGLGSQISQVLAPVVAGRIDRYVKNTLREKLYGRYMDDFYIISSDKERLKICRDGIRKKCEEIGLRLSEKKTQIVKLTHGFTWLKVRWSVTKTGGVRMCIHRSSAIRERRKLKKLRKMMCLGRVTYQDVWNSFQCWMSHARRFRSWKIRKNMADLFCRLFEKDVRKDALYQSI